jgi:hypothetical protein
MLPTFLIIGAMKSGTTALYEMAGAHPDVYVSPVKEPNFFAFAGDPPDFQAPIDRRPDGINNASITDREAYEALYDDADSDQARGEASHTTLYWPSGAPNVKRIVPEVRLVVILRDPVERAYSEHLHFVRDGDEPITDFESALDAEAERIENDWAMGRYVDRGRYDEQLERFVERFDRDQIRVYLHDDLVADPAALAADLYAFLGVDPSVEPERNRRVNKSGVPRSRLLHRTFQALQPIREALSPVIPEPVVDWVNRLKNQNLDKPALDPAVRARLRDTFRPHVDRLEALIDRDLSAWKEGKG